MLHHPREWDERAQWSHRAAQRILARQMAKTAGALLLVADQRAQACQCLLGAGERICPRHG